MKIYLVGGAVRDKLLGLPIKERDWVVVGATPQMMLDQGFKPVGKDFPVFLHPTTHEEYALARTERKTGPGYKGFSCYAAPDVTLAEDLQRRDLTINAMAETAAGQIIDPYHGQADLKNRLLRHVSSAFTEDPVRILRVSRFMARFGDFQIHEDTLILMREMVNNGEIDALVPERVWQEWEKALQENYPTRFFETLSLCYALNKLFPALTNQPFALAALKQAVSNQSSNAVENSPWQHSCAVRFATLFYQIKLDDVRHICQCYKIPNHYRELALLVVKHHLKYDKVQHLTAEACLNALDALDAFRRPDRLPLFLAACEAIFAHTALSQVWLNLYEAAKSKNVKDLVSMHLPGDIIKDILHNRRLEAINVYTART